MTSGIDKLKAFAALACAALVLSACGGANGSDPAESQVTGEGAGEDLAALAKTSTTWVKCATEYERCEFSGTKSVRYGTTTQYVTKTLTGGTACGNEVFGDPAVGAWKYCWIKQTSTTSTTTSTATATPTATTTTTTTTAPTTTTTTSTAPATTSTTSTTTSTASTGTATSAVTWTECAREGAQCSFSGRREVRYGGKLSGQQLITKVAENGTTCNDGAFGAPFSNYENFCWYSSGTTTAAVTITATTTQVAATTAPTTTTTTTATTTTAPSTSTAAGPRVSTFTTSGPITAYSGQVISGVRIQNSGGPCITIPAGATNVVVRDSDIGPCGGSANIFVEGANATIEHNFVHNGKRGVMAHRTSNVSTLRNKLDTFYGPFPNGTAIEYDYMNGGTIDGNVVTGSNYASDAVSMFESSGMRLINNDININVTEPSAAAFTMGDGTGGNPGSNNYVAGNTVRQTAGVPAGVFGSSGNTTLEKNCLTAGIQAYNYSGTFVGVTVRNNVININASFVPDSSVINGWSTNINSTNCALVPS